MRNPALALRGAVLAIVACAAVASSAAAQSGIKVRGVRPEAHLGIGWHGDIGFGARVDIPVAPNGFIDGVEDEFVLSPGGDLYIDDDDGPGDDDDFYFAAVFAPQWNFYVHPEWSVFPELGLALIFGDNDGFRDDDDDLDLDLLFTLGARWHWSSRNALVMRLNWPFGLQIGISF